MRKSTKAYTTSWLSSLLITIVITLSLCNVVFAFNWGGGGGTPGHAPPVDTYFVIDPDQADQGVASGSVRPLTIYDAAISATTSKYAVVTLTHDPEDGATTTYTLDTSLDLSSYPYLYIMFQPGAMLEQSTTETLTVYSSNNLLFNNHQVISSDNDVFAFGIDIPKYGRVEVFPWVSASVSNVRSAEGLWVDVSSSTSMGLQEAIDLAFGDGTKGNASYNLHINGCEEVDGGAELFVTTTPIIVPPLQGAKWTSDAVSITGANVTPILRFDSMMMAQIDLGGVQVIGGGTGPVVTFKPEHGVPIDGLVTIIDSEIHITTIGTSSSSISGSSQAVLLFDGSAGTFTSSSYKFDEINFGESASAYGVGVVAGGPGGFTENFFRCMHIHGEGARGIYMHHSTNCIYELAVHGASETSSIGVDLSYGVGNQISLSSQSAGWDTLIDCQSTSTDNVIICPKLGEDLLNASGSNKFITGAATDRGDPSSVDYAVGDLTTDGAWHDLDLSPFVPPFARYIHVAVQLQHASAGQDFILRKNGNSNTINVAGGLTIVGGVQQRHNLRVECDPDRVIEYFATSGTWTTINLTVTGWEY